MHMYTGSAVQAFFFSLRDDGSAPPLLYSQHVIPRTGNTAPLQNITVLVLICKCPHLPTRTTVQYGTEHYSTTGCIHFAVTEIGDLKEGVPIGDLTFSDDPTIRSIDPPCCRSCTRFTHQDLVAPITAQTVVHLASPMAELGINHHGKGRVRITKVPYSLCSRRAKVQQVPSSSVHGNRTNAVSCAVVHCYKMIRVCAFCTVLATCCQQTPKRYRERLSRD